MNEGVEEFENMFLRIMLGLIMAYLVFLAVPNSVLISEGINNSNWCNWSCSKKIQFISIAIFIVKYIQGLYMLRFRLKEFKHECKLNVSRATNVINFFVSIAFLICIFLLIINLFSGPIIKQHSSACLFESCESFFNSEVNIMIFFVVLLGYFIPSYMLSRCLNNSRCNKKKGFIWFCIRVKSAFKEIRSVERSIESVIVLWVITNTAFVMIFGAFYVGILAHEWIPNFIWTAKDNYSFIIFVVINTLFDWLINSHFYFNNNKMQLYLMLDESLEAH